MLEVISPNKPYFRVYELQTVRPTEALINGTSPSPISDHIQVWIRVKKLESQYVQVAVSYPCAAPLVAQR
jgi:hypothetical protein